MPRFTAGRGETLGSRAVAVAAHLARLRQEAISRSKIELVHNDGPSLRQQTMIWIDPLSGTAAYAILESRSTILAAVAIAAADKGTAAWFAR